jgi:hypothetical protein
MGAMLLSWVALLFVLTTSAVAEKPSIMFILAVSRCPALRARTSVRRSPGRVLLPASVVSRNC